jgi:hypothetical protein
MSGLFAPLAVEFSPTSPHPPSPGNATGADDGFTRHGRLMPTDHRCVCGRSREACVRATVRALWATGAT